MSMSEPESFPGPAEQFPLTEAHVSAYKAMRLAVSRRSEFPVAFPEEVAQAMLRNPDDPNLATQLKVQEGERVAFNHGENDAPGYRQGKVVFEADGTTRRNFSVHAEYAGFLASKWAAIRRRPANTLLNFTVTQATPLFETGPDAS
jgi:hypothetical protein